MSLTPLINIHSRISPGIFKKIQNGLMGYSGARETLIYEKYLMLKISCQTPFNCFASGCFFLVGVIKLSVAGGCVGWLVVAL